MTDAIFINQLSNISWKYLTFEPSSADIELLRVNISLPYKKECRLIAL